MAYGRFRAKYLKFSYFSTISFIILMNVSITYEALSPDYSNVTDSIEPGYLFAKFASKLSALNFRVSRRSNPNTQPDGSRVQCKSQLRVNIAKEIGPWSSRPEQERGRGGGTREAARASAGQPTSTVAVIPSSVFNNSQFRQMITSHCKSEIGFPDCYGHKGSRILQKVVADYENFANGWLPNCNITRECANMAERGRTEKWLRSRWTRISTNRSMNLPVCYEMDDLREVSPERVDFWWFDFCCFTGAICNPFTPAGWGKLLVGDPDSAHQVSQHLSILHNSTCTTEGSRAAGELGLERCVIDTITAWSVLSGPTVAKMQSDAVASLVRCSPDMWMSPVSTFEAILNKLTASEIQTLHVMFDAHITAQKGSTSQQIMNSHSSGSSPTMKRHEFEMTPRVVSGIVVVIILIFLSILVGAWAVYQKVQSWRHPRNHIQYAPIVMQDDFPDGVGSQEEMETIHSWSRVEDLGPDSDTEAGRWGREGGGAG
ncbi:uncharacterized protein LOC100889962 [Strongylocentrotus purpuratus]|uniref:Uncharacterized protein n=1 Tax=Strongylocentrotus purpuratus TaxID=7668 RepID=A0A7M7GLM1_STRPU|nr:uncharacterized protein LOC100889962 [Strongylocentrotus purpuratus]